MIAYLDTNIATWLAQGEYENLPAPALARLEKSSLLISPMVLLELEYLLEIKRTVMSGPEVLMSLQSELDLKVCQLPFERIAKQALSLKWTRDPFDRIIVAHARANGAASLITADRRIRERYEAAIWDD